MSKILHFVFKTQKELTLTMYRFQEYYESPKYKLRAVSPLDLLEHFMDDDGNVTYHSYYDGYNFPAKYLRHFELNTGDSNITLRERVLILTHKAVSKDYNSYIIGTSMKNPKVTNHEISHAIFYLDPEYKSKMTELVDKIPRGKYNKICRNLAKLDYCEEVITDEIVAYCIEDRKEKDVFGSIELDTKQFKKIFKEYYEKWKEEIVTMMM